jgi:hypothetical protein
MHWLPSLVQRPIRHTFGLALRRAQLLTTGNERKQAELRQSEETCHSGTLPGAARWPAAPIFVLTSAQTESYARNPAVY